ncbi:MAG: hypothetical protein ACRECJ_05010 [Limisphaerales bacterium]
MKKFALVLALVLLPASAHPTPAAPPKISFPQKPALSEKLEARLEQQKSKWAPNGMKVLIIHGRRRWVAQQGSTQVEKSEILPTLKEGI